MKDDPWLRIPAGDYEAHMSAIGQSAVLREVFARVYTEIRPSRLAILGCATGDDLCLVDPAVTELVVGVDINANYLEIARRRSAALGTRVHLVHGDVLQAELPRVPFDLVHAALLLEYVDPESLFRRTYQWLSPDGACSLITQDPLPGQVAVSSTGYGTSTWSSIRTPASSGSSRGSAKIASCFTARSAAAGEPSWSSRCPGMPTRRSNDSRSSSSDCRHVRETNGATPGDESSTSASKQGTRGSRSSARSARAPCAEQLPSGRPSRSRSTFLRRPRGRGTGRGWARRGVGNRHEVKAHMAHLHIERHGDGPRVLFVHGSISGGAATWLETFLRSYRSGSGSTRLADDEP